MLHVIVRIVDYFSCPAGCAVLCYVASKCGRDVPACSIHRLRRAWPLPKRLIFVMLAHTVLLTTRKSVWSPSRWLDEVLEKGSVRLISMLSTSDIVS